MIATRSWTRFVCGCAALAVLAGTTLVRASDSAQNEGWRGSLQRGLDSKTNGMGNVASKIAEFREKNSFAVGGLAFNGDGTQLATNGMVAGPEVHLWNWRRPSHIARTLQLNSSAGPGDAICYSADGSLLAVGHVLDRQQVGFGLVRIWNTETWAVIQDIAEPQGASAQMGVAFSPDGTLFVRTMDRASGPNVVVHRSDTWEQVWGLGTRPYTPRTLALSPDGRFAAVGGVMTTLGPQGPPVIDHPQILIVDLLSRKVLRTIAAFPDNNAIHTLSWSPDGSSLAAGAIVQGSFPGPDAVRIFDPNSGKQLVAETAADTAFVNGLKFSGDGRYLIEGYIDGKVRIWDGQHKQLLQSIPVDDHFYTALSISRDSRYLAIAAGWNVSVWELR